MKQRIQSLAIATVIAIASMSVAPSASAICPTPEETETILYTWRLRGGLAWLVGLAFPTSGTAELVTATKPESARIETGLLISGAGKSKDYYQYESEIERKNLRTVMSLHGYLWGKKQREERTRLDYGAEKATVIKKSSKTDADRVQIEPIPGKNLRDILTSIYYLRINADTIDEPIATEVYSDQKVYPVLYRPLGKKQRRIGLETVEIVGFEISARPGDENKWPGGVEVWFTNDERGIPVEISINQRFATMRLEMASAACGTDRITFGGSR